MKYKFIMALLCLVGSQLFVETVEAVGPVIRRHRERRLKKSIEDTIEDSKKRGFPPLFIKKQVSLLNRSADTPLDEDEVREILEDEKIIPKFD